MPVLLESLLAELGQKCIIIQDMLMNHDALPSLDSYIRHMYTTVKETQKEVNRLLSDPALGREPLLAVQYQDYQRLMRDILTVEAFSLPVLLRFNKDDAYMTALCKLLMQQSRISLPPPIVATFSTEYYWMHPKPNLICTSVLECYSLLGLPDLYHEVAHLLIFRHDIQFVAGFLDELRQYVDQEKRRALMEQRGRDLGVYDFLYVQWEEYWIIEFTADMVATFLVGEAYGWQHLRLCSRLGQTLYTPSLGEGASHPADEARLRGIVTMLRNLGLVSAATEICRSWEDYAKHLGGISGSPGDYQTCYPDVLITSLADHVQRACESLGLRSVIVAPLPTDVIVLTETINEAWKLFMKDADAYLPWEKECVEQLRATLSPPF